MLSPTYAEHECLKDGPCSLFTKGTCADCGKPIPNFDSAASNDHRYRNMAGNGFQSHSSNHSHLKTVKGIMGVMPVKRTLCVDCYLLDFQKFYPGVELPPKLVLVAGTHT